MKALRWFGGIAAALLLVLGIIGFGVDTDAGHRFIAKRVAMIRPTSGLRITIGRIDGSVWNKATIRDLRLADSEGLFFQAPTIALDWSPLDWLANRLKITSATAPTATLYRLPEFQPSTKNGPLLPKFDIDIGRLAINRLTIGKDVSGKAQTGSITARADIRSGRALIDAQVRTSARDLLVVKLDSEPGANRFDIAAKLEAPRGGLIGATLGADRPLRLTIDGAGTWALWKGRLDGDTAGTPLAGLVLQARDGQYDLSGTVAPGVLARGRLAALTAPNIRLSASSTFENRRLEGFVTAQSRAIDLRIQGLVDLAENRLQGVEANMRLTDPGALLNGMTGRNVQLRATLNGPIATAAFDYLLTADRVAFGQTGFDRVRASGQGRRTPFPIRVPLKLRTARVTGVGTVAGGILNNLAVDGTLSVGTRILTGDMLRLTSDKLNTRIALMVDFATGRYDVGISGQLGRLFIPGLGIVDITSRLQVVPGVNGRGTRIVGRGTASVRRLDNSFLRSLAGGLPVIDTAFERRGDGTILFTGTQLRAPALRLSGNGYRRPDGTFHFEGSGVQSRYGPVRLKLDGRIDRPHVELLLSRPMDALGLKDVRATLDPTAQGFTWRAAGMSRLGPFTGNGAILLPNGGAATIAIAALDVSGLRVTGALRALPAGFAGQLALAGSGIAGTLGFVPGAAQRIDVAITARDARLVGPPQIAARNARINGFVILDPRGTTIQGTINGRGVRYGTVALSRLDADARLQGGSGTIRANFAGSRSRAFDLQTVAQVTPNRIAITGSGTVDRRAIALTSPAVLTSEGSGWRLAPTELTFAGGAARLSGTFGGSATALDAQVDRLPLVVLDIVNPTLGLSGSASGTLSFVQPSSGALPTGRANLRIKGLSRSGLALTSKPIDAAIAAVLTGNGLAARAVAASDGKTIARAQMRVAPVPGGGTIDRIMAAPLFAQVRLNGPADTLWRLTGVEGIDLSGPVAVAADVGGTLRNPVLRGSLATDGLRIESPVSGTVLTNLKARGVFSGSKLTIDSFTCNAGNGTVTGRANFDLAAAKGFAMRITGNAQNADVIRRDDITATVTGPVTIETDGAAGRIAGKFDVVRSSYRLGRATAVTALPRIAVREIGRGGDIDVPEATPLRWALDIDANIPNRLAVTGLGLDSEWGGNLKLDGSLDAMRITGRLDVIRGGYEFAGKRFDLDRGSLRFTGASPPEPLLDIQASANIQSLAATIRILGTAAKPEITFASTPALPQDELLSRLLFGTSITNLSAPEALQLAAAVGSLRGGGGGLDPINAVRRAVGLDRLRIVAADATTGNKTAVAAGKYITRRTYVEVISDGQGYSATRIEFQVTRWLSLLSTISTLGRQSAAVRVSKDY